MSVEEQNSPTQERWLSHLQRIEEEGLSIRAYALREGISEQSLYAFRRKWKQRSPSASASPAFASFEMAAPRSDARNGCVLEWVNGMTLRCDGFPDPAWLIAVIERSQHRVVVTRS